MRKLNVFIIGLLAIGLLTSLSSLDAKEKKEKAPKKKVEMQELTATGTLVKEEKGGKARYYVKEEAGKCLLSISKKQEDILKAAEELAGKKVTVAGQGTVQKRGKSEVKYIKKVTSLTAAEAEADAQ